MKTGKAELNRSDWLTTDHMKDAPKIKRAHSNILNMGALNSVVGILYTSTPITISLVKIYMITGALGSAALIDVGINGDDDTIVANKSVPATPLDTILDCTILNGAVEAGKMITASVSTAIGTSGTIVVVIEYTEDN